VITVEKERVFSGMRPTGRMHLGNYLGAVQNWVRMQDTHDCIYAIVDYHAMTTPYDPEELNADARNMLIDLLASGIDPEKCMLVVQSQIPQHTELAWILGTITPLSWLERVPTYKEKADMHPDYLHLGLLGYPVLMSADILVYRATRVPVGDDQKPHVELTREIVRRFNHLFGETFPEPQARIRRETARIMSLTEPEKKMSKSLGPQSYIGIGEEPEDIRGKIMSAVTDAGPPADGQMSPGVANLFLLLECFGGDDISSEFEQQYEDRSIRYVQLKEATAEAIIESLAPIRKKRRELLENPQLLERIMERSREEAAALAEETMQDVRARIGLLR